jgi:hypothetical protein
MPEIEKPADGTTGEGEKPDGGEAAKPEAKVLTLTQADLDKIIAERVRRAKPDDYDELVKLREERDAKAEAEKTELQKEKDARAEAEKASKARMKAANERLIRAAILTEAAAQNASDSDIVFALLSGSKDVTVDDEGEVLGAKEAVAKLLSEKPILARGKSSSSGAEFGGNDPKTAAAKITELEQRMNDPKLTLSERQAAGREARALKLGTISQ